MESSTVVFGSTRIPYTVHRTTRSKTVSIAIDPDEGVVLAAPRGVSLDRLDSVVRRKAKWIVSNLRSASERPPPPADREFVSGESFMYAGRQHTLRVIVGQESGTRLDHGRLVVRVQPKSGVPVPELVREQLVAWYRARAEHRLGRLVSAWSERTGLAPFRFSVSSQRRRWGSCSPSGEVRLNWRIVGASKRLVEYVVVHELVHLRHPDHTAAFWRAVAKWIPDYIERREQLREVGPRLVW